MAVLRSSVIRSNGKDASPARRRRKEGEKEKRKSGLLDGGGRAGDFIEPRMETQKRRRTKSAKSGSYRLNLKDSPSNIRYGVVANIAVSHTAAGGSIPPIGVSIFVYFFLSFFPSH